MAITWNPSDKGAGITLSGGNLGAATSTTTVDGVRANIFKVTGKWYFEFNVGTIANPTTTNESIGVANASWFVTSARLGADTKGVSWRPDGQIQYNAVALATTNPWVTGDVIGVAFDADGRTVQFFRNGALEYTVASASVPTGSLYPAFGGDGAGVSNPTTTVNFGATSFLFGLPTGYNALDGGTNSSSVTIPQIVASGASPTVTLTLPAIQASGTGGQTYSTLIVPLINAAGAAVQQQLVSVPIPTALGTASESTTSNAFQVPLALPQIIASGRVDALCSSQLTVPSVAASGTAVVGVTGSSAVTLPLSTTGNAAYSVSAGISTVTLPPILASGLAIGGGTAAYSTVVMHTQTQAVWTYSNFQFNSFARIFGVSLAAGNAGIFNLTGSTDQGAPITASVRFGTTDFNTSHLKYVPRVYIGCRAGADLLLRVRTDESNIRDYRVLTTPITGLHGVRVRIGRGVRARYWQFELQNLNGGSFDLNMLECKPTVLPRRIGQDDA